MGGDTGGTTPSLRLQRGSGLVGRLAPVSLLHLVAGELVVRLPDGPLRVRRGELLAVRGGPPLALERPSQGAEALVFHAPPAWLQRVAMALGAAPWPELGASAALERADAEAARRAGRLLSGAWLDRPSGAAGGRVLALSRWLELVAIACEARSVLEPARPRSLDGRRQRAALLRALGALGERPLEEVCLGGLAAALAVSERHASRLLRQELGISFREFVTGLRLERAKRLLADGRLPITEVALESGWRSLSQFNTAFRRRLGETPGRYRAARRRVASG